MPHKSKFFTSLVKIDSAMDAFLYGAKGQFSKFWGGFSYYMGFMRVRGLKRFFIEIFSDFLTVGFVGLIGLFMLGQYALVDVDEGWKLYQKFSVSFYDKNNNLIDRRGIRHERNVPLEEMPQHMILAALATEDRKFYSHFGIDPMGIIRALMRNIQKTTGARHGASTITQQLARNLFFSNEQTLERKIKEAYMALWLEANLTKNEILNLYFDRAYMGAGNFGLEAAAQFYFGKSIREVDLPESAMLAGLFKAPSNYAPHINLGAARARANVVLTNMVNADFMTHGDVFDARANPASVVVHKRNDERGDYFIDWAFENAKKLSKGKSYVLHVKTTIDLKLQNSARRIIQDNLLQSGEKYDVDQASLVSMETDGAVLALIGGKDYRESQFNRAVNSARQPGSSFKPVVYLAALNHGFKPNSRVIDSKVQIKEWSPKNYNRRYVGKTTLNNALVRSINTIPVKLALKVGYKNIIKVAKDLGIDADIKANASLPLGTSAVSVLDMTGAYATIANGGILAQPYGIIEIRNADGDAIYKRSRDEFAPRTVANSQKVKDLKLMLANVVAYGTGTRANLKFTKTYGKTGTTQSYRDAWFMGFTDQIVTGVWYGNDNYTPTKRLTGGNLPALTFNKFMTEAYVSKYGLDLETMQFKAVANKIQKYKQRPIIATITNTKPKNFNRKNNIITLASNNKTVNPVKAAKSNKKDKSLVTLNGKPLKSKNIATIKKAKKPKIKKSKIRKTKKVKKTRPKKIRVKKPKSKTHSIKRSKVKRGNAAYIDASGKIIILSN